MYNCAVSVQGIVQKLHPIALEAYRKLDEVSLAGCNIGGGIVETGRWPV